MIRHLQTLVFALFLIGGGASYAIAQNNFSLAPVDHDKLIVLGPKGEQVAELTVPAISQSVSVGSISFQISYGLDSNNELSAVLSPSPSSPQPLRFTVLNKSIETDKQAVVTLTFPDPKHVIVDPGYVGNVTVNSRPVRHRDLSKSTPAPSSTSQSTSGNMNQQVASSLPSPSSGPTANEQTGSSNPSPLTPPPLIGSPLAQPPIPQTKGLVGAHLPLGKPLYWAEPITPPSGTPPAEGINEMKLVAVHGPVTIKLPDGETKTGKEGTIVPSGSTVSTANDASAAVFMGGVNSARLMPNSEAKVSENLDGSTRRTDINLKVGTIFSRVGHRPGESQDYEVRTPEGVAAARGTSFSTTVTTTSGREVTIVATEDGVVTLTDNTSHSVVTITPQKSSSGAITVSIGSAPGLPTTVLRNIFIGFMMVVQQFNTNLNAILANPNPTPAEEAYLKANTAFDANTQFYDANDGSTAVIWLNPSDANLYNQRNSIYDVIPNARRATNQLLEPFGTVPITPY